MNKLYQNWIIIILFISSGAIITALIAEHFFNKYPCQLCIYQRYPYYLMIMLSLFYFVRNFSLILYSIISTLSFFVGSIFALWHVGVEKNILPGLSGCTISLNSSESLGDLKNKILSQPITNCEDVIWTFFGFSAASVNSILYICLFILSTIYCYKKLNEKQKKK
ncbi:MAG: Disulfide bond formation protein B [Alphaproteobacteria bacterium MarineAlpha5_Bin9]|nr:MAG: Disulfide bond formation protein B [Alphaproteobacteria bacterium MarineAlpha5_Bin9]|tara:strand:+ start:6722 stop:7216 length:495 start_codon:yes stop_codon:yes gene_type:complete